MESFLVKYRPTEISQMVGNKESIREVALFFEKFYERKETQSPNLIISGNTGIGKSLLIELCIKKYGFVAKTSDFCDVYTPKKDGVVSAKDAASQNRSVSSYYDCLANHRTITSFCVPLEQDDNGDGDGCEKTALVIANVHKLTSSKQKDAIKALIKINNSKRRFPIIIIANTEHNKLVNNLRKLITNLTQFTTQSKVKHIKKTNEVVMDNPSNDDLERLGAHILKSEGFLIKKKDMQDILDIIVDHAQFDARRLVNIAEEITCMYKDIGDKVITLKMIEDLVEISKRKDIKLGIYVATNSILSKYTGIEEIQHIYADDRSTIPLIFHENYASAIRAQYRRKSFDEQLELINKIAKSISTSDMVDSLVFSIQCWNLQPTHGFYSCVVPSFYANSAPNKNRVKLRLGYTKDYNRTSTKQINAKLIRVVKDKPKLKHMCVRDMLYISHILRTLWDRKDLKTFASLIKSYDLNIAEIESIVKINKIKNGSNRTAFKIAGKNKNILKDLLK